MRIAIASDHGGFEQKQELAAYLAQQGHEVADLGPVTAERCDYPDYALPAALKVAAGEADVAVLVCGTGIGMALAANKIAGIRAANVTALDMAALARQHNNANVLTLSGRFVSLADNKAICDAFLEAEFEGDRHVARLDKVAACSRKGSWLAQSDPEVAGGIERELDRQRNRIELIASENFTSPAVMEAVGSVLTNKYAEGYPGKRYYGGCENVDYLEDIARKRVCDLYGCSFANVQPHSGSQANQAVYLALLQPGATILGMNLSHGGHLSHGSPVNISGKLYNIVPYGVDPETEQIDMDEVERVAKECKPSLIIAGASAYPRVIDFERFAEIAHEVGAYFMVDMAHIAGLVATGAHPSPFPHADIVTSTSHKTLRGPRGGFILTNSEELNKKLNSAVFPGLQGGPLEHVVAGKAVAFGEALKPAYSTYIDQVVRNAAALGEGMIAGGLRLVSGGTDNHLCLVDLNNADVTGKDAEEVLDSVGITCNKNTIPNETRSPFVTSGLRVGMPAATTRGFDEADARLTGELIARTVFNLHDEKVLAEVAERVKGLLAAHPLYPELG